MPRFFVNSTDVSADGNNVSIHGNDAVHITRVLRMKPGEKLTVCDENGREYLTEILSVGDTVMCGIISEKMSETEPSYKVTVYQALVKGDRFDTVLQKATELGATAFVPVITSRCVVTVDAKEYEKKLVRWRRIVYEAAKQCGRGRVPEVSEPMKFSDAIEKAAEDGVRLFCYEGDGTESLPDVLSKTENVQSVSVVIGPEGGFSEEEVSFARNSGMTLTGLGRRILRTETAAPFVLACISYKFEL